MDRLSNTDRWQRLFGEERSNTFSHQKKKQQSDLHILLQTENSLEGIKLYLQQLIENKLKDALKDAERIVYYKDKEVYVPRLKEVDKEQVVIDDRGPILPKLEEKLLDNPDERFIKTRKKDIREDDIVLNKETVDEPLPPEELSLSIHLPILVNELLERDEKSRILLELFLFVVEQCGTLLNEKIYLGIDTRSQYLSLTQEEIRENSQTIISRLQQLTDSEHIVFIEKNTQKSDLGFCWYANKDDPARRLHDTDMNEDIILDMIYKQEKSEVPGFVTNSFLFDTEIDVKKDALPVNISTIYTQVLSSLSHRYHSIDNNRETTAQNTNQDDIDYDDDRD